jgi:hypothetical protein
MSATITGVSSRGARLHAFPDDNHCHDARAPGRNHRRDRSGLGTQALRVRSVLDVAASVDAASFIKQRCPYEKARVRRVCTFPNRTGCCDQRVGQ